jgi:hypothetical protein
MDGIPLTKKAANASSGDMSAVFGLDSPQYRVILVIHTRRKKISFCFFFDY